MVTFIFHLIFNSSNNNYRNNKTLNLKTIYFMSQITTTNLSDFGFRELDMAADLLKAYSNGKCKCPFFTDDNVQVMMNTNSGNVFLTDSDCNVLMLNGNTLEGFYSSPYSGHEGFFDELVDLWDDSWHNEDTKWLKDLAKGLRRTDELPAEIDGELTEEEEEN